MERINWVTAPSIDPNDLQKSVESLQKHAHECAQYIMTLNNELIDIKAKLENLGIR